MSLDKLSTELDAKIASQLLGDAQSLSALSKVSKYYRTIAEPYLYMEIVVINNDTWRSWCLLRTILDRSAVALYIKRLELMDVIPTQENNLETAEHGDDDKVSREILAMANAISNHVKQILARFMHTASGVDLACDWIKHLFGRQWTKCLPSLITCLARDLEALTVEVGYIRQTTLRKFITLPWSGSEKPFWKLKEFNLAVEDSFDLHIDIYLRLEIVRIDFWSNHLPAWPSSLPNGSIPSLTTIALNCFRMSPEDIRTIVSSPMSVNAKKLKLEEREDWKPTQYGPLWNFAQFVNVLEEHMPQIEELGWTGVREIEGCTELADFRNLPRLRSLCLGYEFRTPQPEFVPRALLEPGEVFPSCLSDLTIEDIRIKDINNLCDVLRAALDEAEDPSTTISTTLTTMLSPFCLKRIVLIIRTHFKESFQDDRISTPTALFLGQIAEEMFKLGVEMKVHCESKWQPEDPNREPMLVVRKGFIAQKLLSPPPPADPVDSGNE